MSANRFFSYYKDDGFFWFRVYGYGLVFKNIKKHGLLFSERYGYTRRIQIGSWSITTLAP